MNVLQEAESLIDGDREEQYGNASQSFNRIAGLWSAYIGTELTGLDVTNLMILLKVSRTKGTYHRDSYVDIAGYAGLGERLHDQDRSGALWGSIEDLEREQWEINLAESRTGYNIDGEDWLVVAQLGDEQRDRVWLDQQGDLWRWYGYEDGGWQYREADEWVDIHRGYSPCESYGPFTRVWL